MVATIITQISGKLEFRRNGQLHRKNGPAVIAEGLCEEYWLHGKRHREDGPAIVQADGVEEYWQDGRLHRLDGPAVIHSFGLGSGHIKREEYWVEGVRHNLDGPAIISPMGKEYWVQGEYVGDTEEELNEFINRMDDTYMPSFSPS